MMADSRGWTDAFISNSKFGQEQLATQCGFQEGWDIFNMKFGRLFSLGCFDHHHMDCCHNHEQFAMHKLTFSVSISQVGISQ